MKLIGLTGGSGSGKTTAAKLFEELGAAVIDSDVIARKVVLPGTPALKQIRESFGEQFISADGSLDRAALGRLVFSDKEKLAQLNAIMIPAISVYIEKELERQKQEGVEVVILDAPLLFEYHLDVRCDAVVLMCTPLETRIERLMKRDRLPKDEVMNRIVSQIDYNLYSSCASYLLDATDTGALKTEVQRIYRQVLEDEVCD